MRAEERSLDSPGLGTQRENSAVGHVVMALATLGAVIGLVILGGHGLF